MWYNTIYLPWESGQYGTTDTSANSVLRKDDMNGYLKSRTITIGAHTITGAKMTWAIWQLRDQKLPDGSTSRISQIAYSQLGTGMNLVWGGDILRQFNAALLSLIASIGTLIMVISSSFMLLGYEIVLIFLVVLSPFFFLVGAAPGFGRRILMRWFELVTSLVIKRILLTFILAIFLRLYAMVTAIQINWLFQVILLSILAYVAMTQRAKIFSVFTDALNFGGDKSIGFDGAGNKAGGLLKGAAGLAMGAAAGGAGAALGARIGGKGTKITAGLVKGQGLAAPVVGERSKKLAKAEKIASKNANVEATTAALTGGAGAAGAGAKTVASVAAGKATITAKSATTALGSAGAAAGAGASVVGAGASMADRAQEAMSGHQKAVDHRQELRKVQGKSIRKGVMDGAINGMRGKGVASNFRTGVGHRKDEEKSTIAQLAAQGNTERSIAMNKLFALQLEQQEGAQADPVGAQRHAEMMGFDTVEEYNDSRRPLGDREGETYENIDWDELSNVQRKATLNSPEAFQTGEEQQRLSSWQEKVANAQSKVDEVKSGQTKVKSSEWVARQQSLTFNQRKLDAANKEITERVVTRQAAAKNGDFSESDALKSQAARPKLDDFKKAEDAEFERRRAAGGSKPFPNGGK
jgi:hypothetical protein